MTGEGMSGGRLAVHATRIALVALVLAIAAPGADANTPNPTSVTIAGDLQSELGCPSDFAPDCAASSLTYDSGSDVWRGVLAVPAGTWNYKAALNGAFDENYGLHGVLNGANIAFTRPSSGDVKFYYDHKTHWATDDVSSLIVVAAGTFQSELGCPGDWQPDCLRSWLEDPDGDGTYTFMTNGLPQGSYETKATIGESLDVNYGVGGQLNGANIAFAVPTGNPAVTFAFKASTHVLTVTVAGADRTPPVITGQRLPAANVNGWNSTAVAISFSCTDEPGGSGVASVTGSVNLVTPGAGQSVTGTCNDVAGNTAQTTVTGISIDLAAPLVVFSGNAGTYNVDQSVAINCAASDALSGIASASCPGAAGSASAFGLGPHVLSATATDRAGNTASASASFTVRVTPASLCRLTEHLVTGSARYRGAGRAQRRVPDALTAAGCAALRSPATATRQRARLVAAYQLSVRALAQAGWLTHSDAGRLRSFADALL